MQGDRAEYSLDFFHPFAAPLFSRLYPLTYSIVPVFCLLIVPSTGACYADHQNGTLFRVTLTRVITASEWLKPPFFGALISLIIRVTLFT